LIHKVVDMRQVSAQCVQRTYRILRGRYRRLPIFSRRTPTASDSLKLPQLKEALLSRVQLLAAPGELARFDNQAVVGPCDGRWIERRFAW